MATIPLMSDQDVELGTLPSYDDVITGKKSGTTVGSKRQLPFLGEHLADDAAEATAVAYANVSIRLGFLRKVLGILTFQLVATTVFCTALYTTHRVREFVQDQPWILMLTLFGSLALLVAMFVNARNVPMNYFLLTAWTMAQSFAVAVIVAFYDAEIVIEAAFMTVAVVVSLFLYTLQSKRDLQKGWASLFSVTMIFLSASVLQLFIQSPGFNLVMAASGAILFSVYLVLDIDRVMHHTSAEDYIEACVSLYLDIINIFIRILQLLGEINRQ
ncbi:hypothetical protein AB6A40_003163 [Gnathostoma spinigerum]|uniref:Transmembrane BAX inhibitor motif-containing protein 4 n=1 Tax=Gnathostoma spinigerum TaxID=75299 RepID=A0ABD6E8R8_9BILA